MLKPDYAEGAFQPLARSAADRRTRRGVAGIRVAVCRPRYDRKSRSASVVRRAPYRHEHPDPCRARVTGTRCNSSVMSPPLRSAAAESCWRCRSRSSALRARSPAPRRSSAPAIRCRAFDCHCPLLSLPRVFKTNLATVPDAVPYLSVPAEASAAWAERIATAPGLRVGVVWSGSMVGVIDRRPIDLRLLQPLWEVQDVSWFSLQFGDRSRDLSLLDGVKIADLSPWLADFAETAAAIRHLDLVITIDTSVAHLAGALGRLTWVLLPYNSGLAVAAQARRQPLVSDGATVPSKEAGRLARRSKRCRGRSCATGPLKRHMARVFKLLRKPKCALFC